MSLGDSTAPASPHRLAELFPPRNNPTSLLSTSWAFGDVGSRGNSANKHSSRLKPQHLHLPQGQQGCVSLSKPSQQYKTTASFPPPCTQQPPNTQGSMEPARASPAQLCRKGCQPPKPPCWGQKYPPQPSADEPAHPSRLPLASILLLQTSDAGKALPMWAEGSLWLWGTKQPMAKRLGKF